LREILIAGQFELEMLMEEGQLLVAQKQLETAELLKYAIIIVSSLPVIVVYPFLQKYFVKGIMIGALKG
jgi:ABC-type glycerol-3-phosphate transport system permease component